MRGLRRGRIVSGSLEPARWNLEAPVIALASHPGGSIAAALGDGSVCLVPRDGSTEPVRVPVHGGAVLAIAYHSPSGLFLTTGDDGRVCSVSADGSVSEVARVGSRWVEHLVVDPQHGGVLVAMGRELSKIAPDLKTFRLAKTLDHAPGGLASEIGGRFIIAHYDGVTLDRCGQNNDAQELSWPGAHLAACVSPDGKWCVSATQERALHVWPLDGGEHLGMRGYAAKPVSLSWSKDSRLLLTSGLESMAAWRFDGSGPRGRDPLMLGWGGGGLATRVAAHPGAPAGAAGFDNGAVVFADLVTEDSALLQEATGHEVTALDWTPDGLALVTGQIDGALAVYDVLS